MLFSGLALSNIIIIIIIIIVSYMLSLKQKEDMHDAKHTREMYRRGRMLICVCVGVL